jgi:hypothetical protein
LSWSVAGGGTLTIDHGVGDVSSLTSRLLTPSQTTVYVLTATNAAGSATAVVTVTVIAAAPDSLPPTAPTLVSALARGPTEVDLVWTASSDNVAVAGHQVLRNGSVLIASIRTASRLTTPLEITRPRVTASRRRRLPYLLRALAPLPLRAHSRGAITTISR